MTPRTPQSPSTLWGSRSSNDMRTLLVIGGSLLVSAAVGCGGRALEIQGTGAASQTAGSGGAPAGSGGAAPSAGDSTVLLSGGGGAGTANIAGENAGGAPGDDPE